MGQKTSLAVQRYYIIIYILLILTFLTPTFWVRYGVVVQVDIQYPQHLHDLHADYPLAPEQLLIKKEMLSQHSKENYSK